jgi:ribosomal protein S18 acetylase RimI-like enzyme
VRSGPRLRVLSAEQFATELDALTGIYALAMDAPASELPGRISIMERHVGYPAFCAVVAVLPGGPGGPVVGPGDLVAQGHGREPDEPELSRGPGSEEPVAAEGDRSPLTVADGDQGALTVAQGDPAALTAAQGDPAALTATEGDRSALIGFAYGFHGSAGQWWHDVVRESITAQHGRDAAGHWLGDSFEFAEVHVHPDHQGRGTGRAMMHTLAARRPERTAVLSTPDGQTRARRLYSSLGFADLLPAFTFPGTGPSYAIMGAALPLRDEPPLAGRSASPSRR